jgi:DNA-directed RNA polymerase subunit RPC12/RpoP
MALRMRVTIKTTGNQVDALRTAADLRRELWLHCPVQVDPDHPLNGTHRDKAGQAYFEFATAAPGEVRRVIEQGPYAARVELAENPPLPGDECANCGNVAGPVQPIVCPNCGFRDISPCPICGEPIPRQSYTRIAGDLFRCAHCRNRVRLRFNNPMFLPDGSYNQPLVMVEEATAGHEVR